MASESIKHRPSTKDLKHGRSVRQSARVPPGSARVPPDAPELSKQTSAPALPQRSRPSKRPAPVQPAPPKHSVLHDVPAAKQTSEQPPGPLGEPPPQPPPHHVHRPKVKKEILKRAEGRAKVPYKFRDGIKRFFFSPTGILKILRLCLIIGALACFILVQAHESFVAITVLEMCIVIFFILAYMLTIHHLTTYLHWPLLDLINSIITAVFLLIVAILAMQEKNRRKLFYTGGSLCLAAATVCLIDAFVVTKKMRTTLKTFLQINVEKKQVHPSGHSQMHLSSAHHTPTNS